MVLKKSSIIMETLFFLSRFAAKITFEILDQIE